MTTSSLSVHRNTVEQRRKKALSLDAKRLVGQIIRDNDVRAFAFVAIDANGGTHAYWDTGAILPMCAFPSVVAAGLHRSIAESGVVEDWKPSLSHGSGA